MVTSAQSRLNEARSAPSQVMLNSSFSVLNRMGFSPQTGPEPSGFRLMHEIGGT